MAGCARPSAYTCRQAERNRAMHVPGGGSALEPEAHHPHRGAVGRRAAAGLRGIAESGHRHACERRGLLRGSAGASRLRLHRFRHRIKPTFRVGEVSNGPHLIQFATPAKAYLLRVGLPGSIEAARTVLQAAQVVKIGFGLKSDRSRLHQRLGIHAHSLLRSRFAAALSGQKGQVGLRGAVAAVLGRQIDKSRRLATSNWANPLLTEAQQAYAANDAYAALQVFLALPAERRQELLMAAQLRKRNRRYHAGPAGDSLATHGQ